LIKSNSTVAIQNVPSFISVLSPIKIKKYGFATCVQCTFFNLHLFNAFNHNSWLIHSVLISLGKSAHRTLAGVRERQTCTLYSTGSGLFNSTVKSFGENAFWRPQKRWNCVNWLPRIRIIKCIKYKRWIQKIKMFYTYSWLYFILSEKKSFFSFLS
jgi:hypothetical protein